MSAIIQNTFLYMTIENIIETLRFTMTIHTLGENVFPNDSLQVYTHL